jgi:hypothetical protein
MILCAHADAGFHNESKSRSRAGAHIFMSKNDPFPRHNGPILSISQILKFVMFSAATAKLGALYNAAKEIVPLRQTLNKMGWPQPPTPIQMDNSTAVSVTNLTMVPQKTKSMDLRLWWLRCHEAQEQFRFYWDKGSCNLADYHTKHHPPLYHKSNRSTHAGAATQQLRGLLRAYARAANRPPHASSASYFQDFLEAHDHATTQPQPPLSVVPFRHRWVHQLTNPPACRFFSLSPNTTWVSLQGCIVHLRMVCISTKLVTLVLLTPLLKTRLPCYSSFK